MKIEKATIQNLEEIIKIFREEHSKEPYNEKWSYDDAVKLIKDYLEKNIIFAIKEENKIVGFIALITELWWNGIHCFIDEFFISQNYQGKGLGKKLINYTENYLKENNIKRINLMVHKTSKAFEIYKKWNFKEDGFIFLEKEI